MQQTSRRARLRPALALTISLLVNSLALPGYSSNRAAKPDAAGRVNAAQPPAAASPLMPADPEARSRVSEAYGRLPLRFEANHGQADPEVKFISRGSGYSLYLTSTEAVLALSKPAAHHSSKESRAGRKGLRFQAAQTIGDVVRMRLVDASSTAQVVGLEELPGRSNYFLGNDPEKWRTDVAHYAKVEYREVYPGVGLLYYGNQRQLEYDFVVAPGASPSRIKLAFEGARQVRVDAEGDLVMETAVGEVRQHKPVVYQEVNGAKLPVAGRYVQTGEREVGFEIAAYDQSRPLVIDPVLAYSTYLGGGMDDIAYAIAVDSAGNAYLTGQTESTNFPTQNPTQPASGGQTDVFVTKLNAAGTALVYSTYLGGSGYDSSFDEGLALDAAGNIYVTGVTTSTNFPTKNAVQSTYSGGTCGTAPNTYDCGDAFVTKLNAAGNALVYSTYLGGSRDDYANGITIDSAGNAYVVGATNSTNFPTKSALQSTLGGDYDGFVAKLSPDGSALVYSTYLGGKDFDEVGGIAVDAAGNAYVAGDTASSNFPTQNALQPALGGDFDGFVAKLNPAGSALVYSTYLGGSGEDEAFNLKLDSGGNVYLRGRTNSTNFPTKNPLQPTYGGGSCRDDFGAYNCFDAFVAKLNPAGSALVYSTYLGGSGDDRGDGLDVDATGNVYVAGDTNSANFPIAHAIGRASDFYYFGDTLSRGTCGTAPNTFPCHDGFVTKINAAGTALVYSTYLGGSGQDEIRSLAVDAAGNVYVTGGTSSADFPMDPQKAAFQRQISSTGSSDAFVAKLNADNRITNVVTVSAASFSFPVASESIVSAFDDNGMVPFTRAAATVPLPTSLAGTTVKVRDSAGIERLAPLYFIFRGFGDQINYQIPPGTTTGTATVTVTNNNATVAVGTVQIAAVAPGLFAYSGTGQGVAAAVALRVKADGSQSYEPIVNIANNSLFTIPIDLGPETDQVFLILYGTGIRFRSSLMGVTVKIGGADAQVLYAGAAPGFVGLDQVNVRIPRSLIGKGEVDIMLAVDGQTANTVKVGIK